MNNILFILPRRTLVRSRTQRRSYCTSQDKIGNYFDLVIPFTFSGGAAAGGIYGLYTFSKYNDRRNNIVENMIKSFISFSLGAMCGGLAGFIIPVMLPVAIPVYGLSRVVDVFTEKEKTVSSSKVKEISVSSPKPEERNISELLKSPKHMTIVEIEQSYKN